MPYILDTGHLGLWAVQQYLGDGGQPPLAVLCAPDAAPANAVFAAVQKALPQLPVYAGASRPMLRDLKVLPALPAQQKNAEETPAQTPEHGVNALIRLSSQHPYLTLVCLGPLTNLAVALQKEPKLKEQIGRVFVAGGAQLGYGDVTSVAERNIWLDPEAADTVFKSGIPVTLVPKEAAEDYRLAALRLALGQAVAESYSAFIDADVSGSATYGQTVIDPIGYNPINMEKNPGIRHTVVSGFSEKAGETK